MSTGHVLTEEERNSWIVFIKVTLSALYSTKNITVLYYLIVNIYEFSVACCAKEENIPIKLKLLQNITLNPSWKQFCLKLYTLRGLIVHAPYNVDKDSIITVLCSDEFENLIKEFMPELQDDFKDLILGYSRYV